ncbi:uncharacterized protein LOC104440199 [Eucalyptus grandis]|uniref:uncharacterized protein LOC104440199 n=1 Tax=Eucalyptus grandis TaxID=71139 RepID=UPI00192E8AEA|nr:uncharacterized protein LOC104440199 [Eucalyptus grandis]
MEEMVDGPHYRPLLAAVFKGDWEYASKFFDREPASLTARITSRFETVLHIATLSAQDQFVEKLLERLSPDALLMVDSDGCTALHNAVHCGRIKMVKALVRRDRRLTQRPDYKGRVPLIISTLKASTHKEIAWFLARTTTDEGPSHPFGSPSAINPIINLTYAGHHGISVDLDYGQEDENLRNMQRPTNPVPPIKRIHEVKLRYVAAVELAKKVCEAISDMKTTEITEFFLERNLLFHATVKGNSELVKICIQFFPELIRISPNGDSLMTLAVKNRQERILSLFLKGSSKHELSLVPAPTPEEAEKMMLAAAKYDSNLEALNYFSGAAFEIQRELQWFRAVEKWLFPDMRTFKHEGKSYWRIFTEEHRELLVKGGEWVRNTAQSCMIVSTLIATILFGASFNVPKSISSIAGDPPLLTRKALIVFEILDGLSLLFSVLAILIFLAILTSRYKANDFLRSLPTKIMMGLSCLFLSLACMLVAFVAAYTIVQQKRAEWVYMTIASLSLGPLLLFLILQMPLLWKMGKSTYGRGIFRPRNIWK